MKRDKAKLFFFLSGALAVIFLIKTAVDHHNYSVILTSAPFWVTILVNALYFLLPAVILLICGWIAHRKKK